MPEFVDLQRRSPYPRSRTAGAILQALLDHGPMARTVVAGVLGISPATVTGHVAELLERGLARELAPTAVGGIGRPHVPLDLERSAVVGAVHIGYEQTTVALLDLRGRVLAERFDPLVDAPPTATIALLGRRLRQLHASRLDGTSLLGVGVATGGWVDDGIGVMAEHALLGWREVPVADQLETTFGVPVRVDSHARALACAEQLFGIAASRQSVMALWVGNVVDAGYVLGEEVQLGPRSRAGTVAHLPVPGSEVRCGCGRIGCLQASVSEYRFVQMALERGITSVPSMDEVVALACSGDAQAMRLLRERTVLVGRAAALLVDLFNPEIMVVIEDGVAALPECLEILREEFGQNVRSHRDPDAVIGSTFTESPMAVAGGTAILDRVYRDPFSFRTQG